MKNWLGRVVGGRNMPGRPVLEEKKFFFWGGDQNFFPRGGGTKTFRGWAKSTGRALWAQVRLWADESRLKIDLRVLSFVIGIT